MKDLKEDLKRIGGGHLLNEVDFDKVKLPSTVERFLNKFVDSVKSVGLNRIKRSAVLYKIIDAFIFYRPDVSYFKGMVFLAATLLTYCNSYDTF